MGVEALFDDPVGARLLGFFAADDHAVFVFRIAADGEVDRAGFLERGAADEGEVFFDDGAGVELGGEMFVGFGGEGEEDDAGGVGVEAVDGEDVYAQFGFEEFEEAGGASAAGEDGEVGRFVDGDGAPVEPPIANLGIRFDWNSRPFGNATNGTGTIAITGLQALAAGNDIRVTITSISSVSGWTATSVNIPRAVWL